MPRPFACAKARFGTLVLLVALALGLFGCASVDQDPASDWSYDTRAVAIVNTDWGIIPLPNDLLDNATLLRTITLPIYKGDPAPAIPALTLSLPIMTQAAADMASGMSGHTVLADDPLSVVLKTGQNRLNGFVAGSAPTIPFSQQIDTSTLIPYDPAANAEDKAKATLFFVNVTDRQNPQVVAPKNYLAAFNWEARTEMPFYLTIGLKSDDGKPAEFAPGSRYLVVLTKGLKSQPFAPPVKAGQTAQTPVARDFERDTTFLLFAAKPTFSCKADSKETQSWCATALDPALCCALGLTYLAPDGSLRNNILAGTPKDNSFEEITRAQKVAVRQGEGARQMTEDGLQLFEKALSGLKKRDEVILSYTFTISSNPLPLFAAIEGTSFKTDPRLTPADVPTACTNGVCEVDSAKAATSAKPSFASSLKLAADTVNKDSVRLFSTLR